MICINKVAFLENLSCPPPDNSHMALYFDASAYNNRRRH